MLKVIIERGNGGETAEIEYDYRLRYEKEKPRALDVLLQAQESMYPDLAYRYGCRNGICGACTLEVNGRARLACRTPVSEGDRIGALKALPRLKDLVVNRQAINGLLRGRLPKSRPDLNFSADISDEMHNLNRCIECYACLDGCPLHSRNTEKGPLTYGNPYVFLKIQRVMLDPSATAEDKKQALNLARELGIDYYDERKTPPCGAGIFLRKDVIVPLKMASAESGV